LSNIRRSFRIQSIQFIVAEIGRHAGTAAARQRDNSELRKVGTGDERVLE
jgi:hypothetical protein